MSKTYLRHKTEKRTSELKPIQANAAGIDIGSQTHWVSVPPNRVQESILLG